MTVGAQPGLSDSSRERGVVRALAFVGDDAALVRALRMGHPGARAALYDRYAEHVQRVLVRVMGFDDEIGDLLNDTFIAAFDGIGSLEDPRRIRAWLTTIAVYTARGCIRKRVRRRWLGMGRDIDDVHAAAPGVAPEISEAMQAVYRVLESLPADERIPLALRWVAEMELTEVAEACGVSLATIKRRLAAAEKRFSARAQRYPALARWLEGGER